MRDDKYLYQLLDTTWDNYFSDVPQDNIVRVVWGRKAKNRLGSIRLDPIDQTVSIITLNRLFQDEAIPEYILQATLVHELTHYAHGFNSPLERRQTHPHAGGVMRREFAERGAEDLYKAQKKWLKDNWRTVVESNFQTKTRPIIQRVIKTTKIPKPFWFK